MNVKSNYTTVIIGAGISGLVAAWKLKNHGEDFILLEASNKVGGSFNSYHYKNCVYELGPNTLLSNSQELLELIKELDLAAELILTELKSSVRYIKTDYEMQALSGSPLKMLSSNIISLESKFKVITELFKTYDVKENESVAEFSNRHFGLEITNKLIKTFLKGVWAGNIEDLSAKYALKKLHRLAMKEGSILRSILKGNAREEKLSQVDAKSSTKYTIKNQKSTTNDHNLELEKLISGKTKTSMLSFKAGLESLTNKIYSELRRDQISLNTEVIKVIDLNISAEDAIAKAKKLHMEAALKLTKDQGESEVKDLEEDENKEISLSEIKLTDKKTFKVRKKEIKKVKVNSKLEFSSSLSSENLIDDSVYDANDDLARFLNEPVDQENFSENNHDESLNSKPEINSKSTSSQLNQPASTEKENDHLSQDNLSNSSMNLNNSKYNYQISYKDSDGHVFNAQRVILAVPAYIASNLIGDLNLSLAKALKKINYAPMFLYTFSVAKSLFKADLEGFGYLVESDQPASLGAIFSSQVFKERNLESEYLLTAFVGGANFELASYFKQRELDKFSKADLEQKLWENTVVKEQAKFLSDFTRVPLRNNDLKLVNTWSAKHAIPQYNLNSEDARTKLKEHMELDPSLVFASNYLYGISVADTIKSTIELMIN